MVSIGTNCVDDILKAPFSHSPDTVKISTELGTPEKNPGDLKATLYGKDHK